MGALFFRTIASGVFGMEAFQREITAHSYFYIYMTLSTPIILGLFGAYLGRLHDRILAQKNSLEVLTALFKRQSITDDITGLYNHRYLVDQIQKELERTQRYDRLLSGIMIDIDNFKSVNDHHGHLAGDKVLREVAKILKKSIRKVDIVGRYGGDEFLILLPETRFESARLVAERTRHNVHQHHFSSQDDTGSVSTSIGLLMLDHDKKLKPNAFIQKVDEAMFKAKGLGKDRIFTYEPEASVTMAPEKSRRVN